MEKLTRENYHNYKAVSNSSLNWLLPETGGSFKKYQYYTSLDKKPEESESMRFGTLVHLFVEKGTMDVFQKCSVPSPAIKAVCDRAIELGGPESYNVLEAIKQLDYQPTWKDDTRMKKVLDEGHGYMTSIEEARKKGKELVTQDEYDKLLSVTENIISVCGKDFVNLTDGYEEEIIHECPIKFTWPGTDIECKALIDLIVLNHKYKTIRIYDVKTTSVPLSIYFGYKSFELDSAKQMCSVEVEGQAYKRNIHRQLAFYATAALQKWSDYTIESTHIIGVETQAPYEVICKMADDDRVFQIGNMRINEAMSILKSHGVGQYDL